MQSSHCTTLARSGHVLADRNGLQDLVVFQEEGASKGIGASGR